MPSQSIESSKTLRYRRVASEDLEAISLLSQALWIEPEPSREIAHQTLLAVSSLQMSALKTVEKTCTALLEQAQDDSRLSNKTHGGWNEPFFRLAPEQRIVLIGLHTAQWSYRRLSRILDLSIEEVETLAWKTRIQFVSYFPELHYPTGAPRTLASCPEYDHTRPWTQRFLDEETPPQEQQFLQNHLMACSSCREALNANKRTYYDVEKRIPVLQSPGELEESVHQLNRTLRNFQARMSPEQLSFTQGLIRFFSKRDTVFVLMMLAICLLVLARFGT